MSRTPQPLGVTVVPSFRQQLLFAINTSTHCILSFKFDPTSSTPSLVTYYWPVEGKERVRPDALHHYRETHQFLGPCCLCPLLTPLSGESRFTEAAMYIPVFGRYAGEYVAECAKSRCGYLVPLERIYPKVGVPLRRFPTRGQLLVMLVPDTYRIEDPGTVCPPRVFHLSELEFKGSRALKRTYAQADLTVPLPARNVALRYETDWRKIVKLDRLDQPGLSEVEFFGLFVKCDACKLVMARQVFSYHNCILQTEDGWELTDVEE